MNRYQSLVVYERFMISLICESQQNDMMIYWLRMLRKMGFSDPSIRLVLFFLYQVTSLNDLMIRCLQTKTYSHFLFQTTRQLYFQWIMIFSLCLQTKCYFFCTSCSDNWLTLFRGRDWTTFDVLWTKWYFICTSCLDNLLTLYIQWVMILTVGTLFSCCLQTKSDVISTSC